MRIISQDGMIDLPYEQFIISLNAQDMHEVIAWTGEHIKDDECITLAYYSTEAKARKAMEMLHAEYIVFSAYKTMSEEEKNILVEVISEKEKKAIWGLFQFPADDEVEG